MTTEEKFINLRFCVRVEGEGDYPWLDDDQKAELLEFIDLIEERWGMFEEEQ